MMKSAAVIAAAGLSSRMNTFKPLLRLGEKTMIETVIDNFRRVGVSEIVVVGGYQADILEKHLAGANVTVCVNEKYADTKMFDSIRIGLRALRERYDVVFVTPGDVPLVKEDTLRKMLTSGAGICRPRCGERNGHPAMFAYRYAVELLAYEGENGMIGAMHSMDSPIKNILVNDSGAVLDADTPEDFEKLRHLYNSRPSF